jgi:hypothetical protein
MTIERKHHLRVILTEDLDQSMLRLDRSVRMTMMKTGRQHDLFSTAEAELPVSFKLAERLGSLSHRNLLVAPDWSGSKTQSIPDLVGWGWCVSTPPLNPESGNMSRDDSSIQPMSVSNVQQTLSS